MVNLSLRILLSPLGLLYGLVLYIRRKLYDIGVFKRYTAPFQTVCIGNIKVGGTGKTPHVIWYIEQYAKNKKVAVLSRGYGRKSKGFYSIDTFNPHQFGDEPTLIWQHFKGQLPVFVGEDRAQALRSIYKQMPDIELVVLDDAFQHLAVRCDTYILLTEYAKPYFQDYPMPMGTLREFRNASRAADEVLITKCPPNLSAQQRQYFRTKISCSNLRFSRYEYAPQLAEAKTSHGIYWHQLAQSGSHLLVTALANTSYLRLFLDLQSVSYTEKRYRDHHAFEASDIDTLNELIVTKSFKSIVTTAKDYVKLVQFQDLLKVPIYIVHIRVDMF